jgi:radical SAM modification target selenobiotic family peptide
LDFSIHIDLTKGGQGMDKKELKKMLAGIGVAGLLSMGGVAVPGAHATGSG